MATERDLYAVLGVERNATDAEIKRAFRRLAQQWHPDVNKDAGAQARFKEINEAYQVLSDPQRRQAYDMFGTAGDGADAGGFEPAASAGSATSSTRSSAGRRPADAARPPARRLRPPLRPPDHPRGGRPGIEKEIEFPVLGTLRDVLGQRRQARHGARDLRPVRRPRRDPDDAPDDARPDGQRHGLPEVPGRGQARSPSRARRAMARAGPSASGRSG